MQAYSIVLEKVRLTKAKPQAANENIDAVMINRVKLVAGDRAWMYGITGGGTHVFNPAEGSLAREPLWTGSYKMLCVGPGNASDWREVGPRSLLMQVRTNESGRGITARVSVHRCKKCHNPHEGETAPRFLSWSMSNYVLRIDYQY